MDQLPQRSGIYGLLEKLIDERCPDSEKIMAFVSEFLPGCRVSWQFVPNPLEETEIPSCRESFMRLRSVHDLPWRGQRLKIEFPLVCEESFV